MLESKKVGKLGENLASQYLEKNNYKIIERNFTCEQGEIDIVAKDEVEEEYVFIEVKTRRTLRFGEQIENVNDEMQKHIKNSTTYYVYKNELEKERIRVDIIEVLIFKTRYKIKHIKQIF